MCSPDWTLSASPQSPAGTHTPPVRHLPCTHGTHTLTHKLKNIKHTPLAKPHCSQFVCCVCCCAFQCHLQVFRVCVVCVSRVVPTVHSSALGRRWRWTPDVYLLCTKAFWSISSLETLRQRYRVFTCCIQ